MAHYLMASVGVLAPYLHIGDEAAVYQGDVDYDVQFLTADGEQLNDLFFARTRAGMP